MSAPNVIEQSQDVSSGCAPATGSASVNEPRHCDLQLNPEPVCPYCGHKERDAWEIDFGSGMDGEAEITCGKCENDYNVERCVSVDYTTSKLPNAKLTDPEQ